jgi:hypothetical protein
MKDKVGRFETYFYVLGKYEAYARQAKAHYGRRCKSKVCSFDLLHLSLVCGPVPKAQFKTGSSCLDGRLPLTESEFDKTKKNGEDRPTPSNEDIQSANEGAAKFSKFCSSGKCTYFYKRGAYICGASALQPTAVMLLISALTLTLTFLRVLP